MDWCPNSDNYTNELDATCVALLIKFGHVEYKVEPILDQHLFMMQQVCDYTKEEDMKRICESFITRHFSHRNITWVYAKVGDCTFHLKVSGKKIRLDIDFIVRKIKGKLESAHKQN